MKRNLTIIIAAAVLLSACITYKNHIQADTGRNMFLGGALGAGLGGAFGGARGAGIGAGIGMLSGAIAGSSRKRKRRYHDTNERFTRKDRAMRNQRELEDDQEEDDESLDYGEYNYE